jgi:Ferritin-like
MQEKPLQARARKSEPKTERTPGPKPAASEGPGKTPGHKIFPRNLTAQADYLVPGNPVISRPEDAVANCFPGLELDVRNLDRRFFPGLVFNFVAPVSDEVPGMHYGAKLVYIDVPEDPDLGLDPDTAARLSASLGIKGEEIQTLYDDITNATELLDGKWYLDWVKQGKARLSMNSLNGLQVWRLLRGLEPGRVEICLKQKEGKDRGSTVRLKGWRRLYADPKTGVISGAYQPGELMQGLCSPWQHDFRDCACHYWPANHPDVVLGEIYPGEPTLPGGDSLESARNVRLDWLREDRSLGLASAALNTIPRNRPYQIDHFRINHDWQNLDVVVEGREVGSVYVPSALENANPFGSPDDLLNELQVWLAPLELTLIFEYLYARFSVRTSKEVMKDSGDETLAGIVDFVRYNLLLIATSEMHHLRWANELLWKLCKANDLPFTPVLEVCEVVPKSPIAPTDKFTAATIGSYVRIEHKIEFHPADLEAPTKAALTKFQARNPGVESGYRERALRPLRKDVISDFIALEHPSSFIDGAYARVIATLRQANYSPDLVDVATRIASEGMEHERHFIDINTALAPYQESEYLRPNMQVGTEDDAARALQEVDKIIESLRKAYRVAGQNKLEMTNPDVAAARAAMNELLSVGEKLGSDGIGIPFFSRWESSGSSRR